MNYSVLGFWVFFVGLAICASVGAGAGGISAVQDAQPPRASEDDLRIDLRLDRVRIFPFEEVLVRVTLENAGDREIAEQTRGYVQFRKQPRRGDVGEWKFYSRDHGRTINLLRLKPGESRTWMLHLGPGTTGAYWYHVFEDAGAYDIRYWTPRGISASVRVQVDEPDTEADRRALRALREAGLGLALSREALAMGRERDEADRLERFLTRHGGTLYGDLGRLALAAMRAEGTGGAAKNPASAKELARKVFEEGRGTARFQAAVVLADITCEFDPGRSVEEAQKVRQECVGHLRKAIERQPSELYRELLEREIARIDPPPVPIPEPPPGEPKVILLEQRTSPGPWLPVWLVVQVEGIRAMYKAKPEGFPFRVEIRRLGTEEPPGEWIQYVPSEVDLAYRWPNFPAASDPIFSMGMPDLLEYDLMLQQDREGRHAFEEPGRYEVRVRVGELARSVTVEVEDPLEEAKAQLTRLREAGFQRYLGRIKGAWIVPDDRPKVQAWLDREPDLIYARALRLQMAITLRLDWGAEPELTRLRGNGKKAWEMLTELSEGEGVLAGRAMEAMAAFALWAHGEPDAEARLREGKAIGRKMLEKWSDPAARWLVERHFKPYGGLYSDR